MLYVVMLHAVKEGIAVTQTAPDSKPYVLKLMDQAEEVRII